MQFYKVQTSPKCMVPPEAILPCILISRDNWDDYNFNTLHHMFLCESRDVKVRLGDVKILQIGEKVTELPKEFTELGDEFFSLGQEPDYYRVMRQRFPNTYLEVLEALNDVVVKTGLLETVETTSGFRNSLIRFNDAKICLRDGAALLENIERKKGYSFTYTGQIAGSEASTTLKVDLQPQDPVPGRIFALIGRNGVGKTQFMAKLALDLATTKQVSKTTMDQLKLAFQPNRPLFSRVIALSFSAFDRFQRPEPQKFFSYIYCGVRDDKGGLSRKSMDARHLEYLRRIVEHNRELVWERHVAKVMGVTDDEVDINVTIKELESEIPPSMSSGQSILAYFIAAATAYLKEESLILFDEPETHLHPNAVALLIQTLQSLLEEYDAYAIIATHSPVVIQEVPRKRVVRFERDGNLTTAHPLATECFGENIAVLTRQVFETIEIPNFYKETFKQLAKTMDFDAISKLFQDQLSLHATAYLASLYEDDHA